MELVALLLSVVSLVGLGVVLVLWRALPAYAAEKAKNLASKEDLAHLTAVVEGVKASHTIDIERLRASLSAEAQVTERRRRLYEDVCGSLRIFVEGQDTSGDAKNRFHASYAAVWLWGSDEVVNELNRFVALKRQEHADPASVTQPHIKAAYVSAVLAMRRDVGFSGTTVDAASYQFFKFV